MAIQLSTTVRNAMLDAMETAIGTTGVKIRILTGTQPATCATAQSGTLIAEFTLAADWAANAASGSKAFNSITGVAASNANAGGTMYYRLISDTPSAATAHEQGTVTATGGGGDMTIDNMNIAAGQTVNITGWSWTEPGA